MSTKRTNKPSSIDYKEILRKKLEDPTMAAGYLTAAFEEGEDTFLLALKDVAEAYGGLGLLAAKAKLNREGLYAMLSEKGNPRLSSLSAVLEALGIRVEFTAKAA